MPSPRQNLNLNEYSVRTEYRHCELPVFLTLVTYEFKKQKYIILRLPNIEMFKTLRMLNRTKNDQNNSKQKVQNLRRIS